MKSTNKKEINDFFKKSNIEIGIGVFYSSNYVICFFCLFVVLHIIYKVMRIHNTSLNFNHVTLSKKYTT